MQKRFNKLALLVLCVPALAMAQALPGQQGAAGNAAGNAPQAAPAAPPVVTIDSAKRAAIKDLLDAIDGEKLANAIANGAQQQVKQAVPAILSDALSENQGLTEDQKRAAVPSLQQNAVPKLVNDAGQVFATPQFHKDAIDAQYQAYAQHYSTQEIKDLTTFYRSPTGKKFIQEQDQVGRYVVGSLSQKYMPQAIQAVRAQADSEVAAAKPAK